MKKFFGYSQYYYNVTAMLLALGLPLFDTVIHNYKKSFLYVWSKHSNDVVKLLCESVCILMTFTVFYYTFFTYSVCLSVCLCVFAYGPCCLIQIK